MGEIEKITSIDLITFNGKKENNNLRVNFEKKNKYYREEI